MYNPAKCIGCGECVRVCPEQACNLDAEGGLVTDMRKCRLCGQCVAACPTLALEMVGDRMSVEEIIDVVEKQRTLIDQSGGGITLSGGEPLMQPEFVMDLLEACGARGIHRAVDTAGIAPLNTVLAVAELTDYFLFDLKLIDPAKHKQWTGLDNELILSNLKALAETGARIEIRMPLIRGVNCDPAAVEDAAAFVAALAGEPKPVALLPFHNLAAAKLAKLGKPAGASTFEAPFDEDLERIVAQFGKHGLNATVGG